MKLRITVEGKAYDVDVEVLDEQVVPPTSAFPSPSPAPISPPTPPMPRPISSPQASAPPSSVGERAVKAPIVGTIIQVKVSPGDAVALNQVVLVMEAMKMETNVASPFAGKVKAVCIAAGDAVKAGQVLIELE